LQININKKHIERGNTLNLIDIYKIMDESEVPNNTDFCDNILICGDCLNVMGYIPDKSIDCIITDLPYG